MIANVSIISMASYLVVKLIPNERNFTLNKHQKLIIFLFVGLTSFLLMFFSVNLPDNLRIDLRHVAIILFIYYFGPSFSIPMTIYVSVLRLYWGINLASSLSAITYLLIGILLPVLLEHLPVVFNKYMTLLLFNAIFVVTSGFNAFYITRDLFLSVGIFLLFLFISTVVVLLDTLFIEDMIRNRQMYLNEKEYAKSDYLTGLLNVREFNKQWQLIQANEKYYKTAFLMLDIDHFKNINDTYGHANGNLVLQQLAIILKINSPAAQQIYRIGGEEFCLILTNLTKMELNQLAEKIREDVASKPFQLEDDNRVNVTISIGVASTEEKDEDKDFKKLFRLADRCLYQAKDQGRNKVVIQAM